MINVQDAIQKDLLDPLRPFREAFYFPEDQQGTFSYFCGNSLGLQPKKTSEYVTRELKDWAKYGVEAHLEAKYPWVKYHEFLTPQMAEVVGAKDLEVVVMNTLTVNLHLMLVSFYRPSKKRNKILIEYSSFPSDRYAVESQLRFHGFDPKESLLILNPEEGSDHINSDNIKEVLIAHGEEIALVLIGSVNYYTGQAYPIKLITELAHSYGCFVGFDLAHGAGNLKLNLHDDGPDFAIWCSYKYLNSGPGSLAGCFVHERHAESYDIPRLAGWWGHDKVSRFKMSSKMQIMPGAEGWQLSNPPILPMACIMASLEIFHQAGMLELRKKSIELSGLLINSLKNLNHPKINILTPLAEDERGSQVSIQILHSDKSIYQKITKQRIIADWREPDVIRVAPVPLYNSYQDVYLFCETMKNILQDYD